MNLRAQSIAAVLLAGSIAATLAGGVAWWQATAGLQEAQLHQAHAALQADVNAYTAAHGSWEKATQAETLRQFLQRTRSGGRPQDRRDEPFALLDSAGRVVLDAGPFVMEQVVPASQRQGVRPLRSGGEVVLQALPVPEPLPDVRARHARSAITSAVWIGLAAGCAASLLLALAFGQRLSGGVRGLVQGLKELQADGEQRRRLPAGSEDEIGAIARAYNALADDLSRAQTRLREAEATVKQQGEDLVDLSVRDPLTGLFNRRHFDEQVRTLYHQAVRHERPLSIALIDLDNFKQINEKFSHAMGDLVLKRVGELLRENVRKSDVVARYGSGEFVVVCPESNVRQTARRCEALRKIIEGYPWHEADSRLAVTISAGVSDGVGLGDVEKMIGEADARLYGVKIGGQNRVEPAPEPD